MDMFEEEEKIQKCLNKFQSIWKNTILKAYDIAKATNDNGSCIGWLNTWAPGLHAQMQCDISVMISNEMYHTYYKPELCAQSEILEYPLYHFDGIEQIRHLDTLLSIDKLKMIQWTSVTGQPSPIQYIPYLKKIQEAGKCLMLQLKPSEVEPIMTQLSSKGLYLYIEVDEKTLADDIVRQVSKLTRD